MDAGLSACASTGLDACGGGAGADVQVDGDRRGPFAYIGLSEGEVFDRLVLDRLQQEMVKQYFSQGRYAVEVDTRVTELERNRVRIAIVIDEGDVAEIRHINIVGNETFTDKEIREEFEADIVPWWKFWSKDGQYSREKLSGDMEKLRSYYLDRGYVDFSVESTQVSISPEKKDIFITANVVEGDVYGVDEGQITGDLVIDEGTLQRLIITQPGEIFSRKKIEQSVENITAVLSNIGYAFATMNRFDDGSENLAEESGGFTVKNTNDLEKGIQRIAKEARAICKSCGKSQFRRGLVRPRRESG